MIDKSRELALKALYKIEIENAYSNIILDELLNENKEKLKLNAKDIGLISEIVYGVTTWRLTLDEIIKKYSKIKLKKVSPWIKNILRMGIYQIIFLDKIPKSAAVNESVNLAKRYGHSSSSGYVNAILRRVNKDDYKEFSNIEDYIDRISKIYAMPIWIIEELLKEGLDKEQIENICKNSNLKPNLTIRVNRLKIKNKQILVNQLKQENESIEIKEGILEDFFIVKNIKNMDNLKSFKDGLFTVQDEGAGLISLILEPKAEDEILDSCSSPGGKTSYIAELAEDKSKIIAGDIHKHRVELVNNISKRLGIKSIKTILLDATKYNEEYKEKFDKILLDVPCLGIGVLKRKPDIKWQKKKEDIKEISDIQYKILENNAKYLKKGGELTYSTCSIFKEENENVIEKFLQNNKNFEMVNLRNILKKIENNNKEKYFEKYIREEKYIQIYQNEYTDGFFICKLKKKI